MNIGKRVYYDNTNGEVILNTGERSGSVVPTTAEDDIRVYKVLSERNSDTFGFLEFEYGEHDEQESIGGYISSIDLETKKAIFAYPTLDEKTPVKTTENPFDTIKKLEEKTTMQDKAISELTMIVTNLLSV